MRRTGVRLVSPGILSVVGIWSKVRFIGFRPIKKKKKKKKHGMINISSGHHSSNYPLLLYGLKKKHAFRKWDGLSGYYSTNKLVQWTVHSWRNETRVNKVSLCHTLTKSAQISLYNLLVLISSLSKGSRRPRSAVRPYSLIGSFHGLHYLCT